MQKVSAFHNIFIFLLYCWWWRTCYVILVVVTKLRSANITELLILSQILWDTRVIMCIVLYNMVFLSSIVVSFSSFLPPLAYQPWLPTFREFTWVRQIYDESETSIKSLPLDHLCQGRKGEKSLHRGVFAFTQVLSSWDLACSDSGMLSFITLTPFSSFRVSGGGKNIYSYKVMFVLSAAII